MWGRARDPRCEQRSSAAELSTRTKVARRACVLLTLLLHGCNRDTRPFQMGVTYWTPADPSLSARSDVIGTVNDRAITASEVIQLQVPWSPTAPNINVYARPVAWLARSHGRNFALAVEWLDGDRKHLRAANEHPWSFTDPEVEAVFTNSVVDAAKELRPEYMVLGVEVNFSALYDPPSFRAFVAMFPRVKAAVKAVLPSTLVLVTFQYELIRGYHGHGPGPMVIPPHPELIEHFGSDLDMIGLSTYPQIEFDDPRDIPRTFFDVIPDIGRPVGVFETSWRTTGGTSSDEETQDRYLSWLLQEARRRDFRVLLWTSACDTLLTTDVPPRYLDTVHGIAGSMGVLGLWTLPGEPKIATPRWLGALSKPLPEWRKRPERPSTERERESDVRGDELAQTRDELPRYEHQRQGANTSREE